MTDNWEQSQLFEALCEVCMVEDALSRACDALTVEELERSEWAYAYGQVARAEKFLDRLKRRVLRVRTRRLEAPIPRDQEMDEG